MEGEDSESGEEVICGEKGEEELRGDDTRLRGWEKTRRGEWKY